MTEEKKSESARYWQEHLLSWEASAYYKDSGQRASWWDRLSTVFRGNAMYVRMQTALELVKPHLPGKTVMDVGCASGRFPFQMVQAGAEKVYGVDISAEAVGMAEHNRQQFAKPDKLEFMVEDLIHPARELPKVDIVTALGVIEYFDAATMGAFLRNLHTNHILLDFPDLARRQEFPTWPLRQVYIRVNRLPGVYLYSLEDFRRIAEPLGYQNLRIVQRNKFFYVTNLPQAE
jgi:SAM-dependent methyltransferase